MKTTLLVLLAIIATSAFWYWFGNTSSANADEETIQGLKTAFHAVSEVAVAYKKENAQLTARNNELEGMYLNFQKLEKQVEQLLEELDIQQWKTRHAERSAEITRKLGVAKDYLRDALEWEIDAQKREMAELERRHSMFKQAVISPELDMTDLNRRMEVVTCIRLYPEATELEDVMECPYLGVFGWD